MADIQRSDALTPEVSRIVDDMFEFHAWDDEQRSRGAAVREVLAQAMKVIVAHVEPGPDRSSAFRKLREVRMDCNSAITHRGKY